MRMPSSSFGHARTCIVACAACSLWQIKQLFPLYVYGQMWVSPVLERMKVASMHEPIIRSYIYACMYSYTYTVCILISMHTRTYVYMACMYSYTARASRMRTHAMASSSVENKMTIFPHACICIYLHGVRAGDIDDQSCMHASAMLAWYVPGI